MAITSETELKEAIRDAPGPLRIRGGGTRDIGRPVAGAVLDVSGLTGITLYEPGALTIVARAGTSLADVEAALAVEGQRLAFEPADWRGLLGKSGVATLGGMVAANASGPRRIQAGACRDALLGVRFVDGTGRVIKNGGRVMKNVTGYDLVKLMAGSWGTLGVVSEVALKVLPAPGAEATLILEDVSGDDAYQAMTRALASPYDVTGAAHGGTAAYLRIEGFAQSVAYRSARLSALVADLGKVRVVADLEESRAIWRDIRDIRVFHDQAGDVWRLSVKPSDAMWLAARAGASDMLFDWGGGLIWLLMPEGCDLRARLGAFSGHATLIRAAEEVRARIAPFQPEPPPLAALSDGLRARFDPKGILNPGLMG